MYKYRSKYVACLRCVQTISLLMLIVLLMMPMQVYATNVTANAVSDIMNNERFVGAIESIEWLTVRIDYWFTMVITATAFFIISSALLKNVCAGAYCANHKFWDKVAEAHEKSDALSLASVQQFFTGRQFMQMSKGGIRDALLNLVPNIKALTDFDDADIEPKQYFMKAIPQMLLCVIIGVFIYNGYYRDTAATVGQFGSEICERIFSSVDPTAFVDKLSQTTGTPENIYEKDITNQGKDIYAISSQIYKTYLSNSKTLTSKEAKASLMRDAESIAYDQICAKKEFADLFYSDSRAYDFSVTNLSVVPCPQSSAKNIGSLHIVTADKETNSKYSVAGYFNAPNTANSYISDDCKAFYCTFVMQGAQKESTDPRTSIIATSGNWNSSANVVVQGTVSIGSDTIQTESKVGNDSVYTTKKLNLDTLITQSDISDKLSDYFIENKINGATITRVTFNGYSAGTATNPQVRFVNAKQGDTLSGTMAVYYSYTETKEDDSQGTEPQTGRVTCRWELTLGSAQGAAN